MTAPTLALVLEGERAVGVVRETIGATDCAKGTIRGHPALSMPDGSETAMCEIEPWFGDELA